MVKEKKKSAPPKKIVNKKCPAKVSFGCLECMFSGDCEYEDSCESSGCSS